MMDDDEMMGPTMGLAAPVFLAIWVAMMVAMMFPTAMPMILTFARVQAGKAARDQTTVPVGIFVAAYLLVWIVFGIAGIHRRISRRRTRRSVDVADGQRRAYRRRSAHRGGDLPVVATEEDLPLEVPLAHVLAPELMARRAGGRAADGR